MRGERAKELFLQGYNCAQAVALAYEDMLDIPPDQIAKMVSGFGGGISRMREVCGSVSGAVFVISSLYGYSEPGDFEGKKKLYSDIQYFCKEFQEINGSIVCRELLGLKTKGADSPSPEPRTDSYYKKRPCAELIKSSADILEKFIEKKNM